MCGISGFINISFVKNQLEDMLTSMQHRGPDDKGIFIKPENSIGLGHVRLSIIDLSQLGKQPMFSDDGRFIIVFNGEIYNYLELKFRLQALGFCFKSTSDTEVLLHAYQEWGTSCLDHLNGMFAFALHDVVRNTTFIARDRFGEKPFYYSQLPNNGFIFSSEIRSLIASKLIKPKLNRSVLPEFLAQQTVHYSNTLIENVYSLEPAHYILISKNTFEKKCYWQAQIKAVEINQEQAFRQVRDLFIDSVDKRLVSDAPLGAFLSGGIDSSILVGVAANINKTKFNTYTIAFDNPAFKDGYYSQIAANHFGTIHHEIKLSLKDVLHEIPQALQSIDHPSADGVNIYLVSKAVKQAGLKVALSGLGGDEIFGGYASFKQLSNLAKYNKYVKWLPQAYRKGISNTIVNTHSSINLQKMSAYLQSDLSIESNYAITRQYFFNNQIKELSKNTFDGYNISKENVPENYSYSTISKLEQNYYMHDVLLRDTDQMSMANSLEVRAPFLDYRLLELVLSIPNRHKTDSKINKSLFVNALIDFIPEELLYRPKQGFVMPFDHWMRNELNSYCKQKLTYLKENNIFDAYAIDYYWHCYLTNTGNVNWARLWLLVNLAVWMETNNIN
jgi:asparagine synthase (glutamine-hydrolysing)